MIVKAVIFDVDGTLCDVSSVRHYVEGERKDFDKFHKASLFCPPREDVRGVWERASMFHRLVVTGRDAKYADLTMTWLHKHGFHPDRFYTRPWGDQRPDHVVKDDILGTILAQGFDPVYAVDDREDIAQVWRRNGIRTWVVPVLS